MCSPVVCEQLNAMANRAAGKGYENEDHYTNIKLQFIGIENIHVMRSSQQKIIDGKPKISMLDKIVQVLTGFIKKKKSALINLCPTVKL